MVNEQEQNGTGPLSVTQPRRWGQEFKVSNIGMHNAFSNKGCLPQHLRQECPGAPTLVGVQGTKEETMS